ncbi:hypothetical protein EBESD8_32280 [Rhodococcus aetherivorans]|nr:hypothetical protein EBESD8_32280 [Rhodococcus aetherivorans]
MVLDPNGTVGRLLDVYSRHTDPYVTVDRRRRILTGDHHAVLVVDVDRDSCVLDVESGILGPWSPRSCGRFTTVSDGM